MITFEYDHTKTMAAFIEETTKITNKNNTQDLIKQIRKGHFNIETQKRIDNILRDNGSELTANSLIEKFQYADSETIELAVIGYKKSASKQNIPEKCVIHVFGFNGIDIQKLPSSGKDRRIIRSDGTLSFAGNPREKDIDFRIITKDGKIYANHKYARTEGGHQGNQKVDVERFLQNAVKFHSLPENKESTTRFAAIFDGEWKDIEQFKSIIPKNMDKKILVCNTDELISLIEQSDG